MLTTRQREPEIMDDPTLDPHEHERALRGLSRLNACSGSVWALWQPIRRLAATLGRDELRILDVATGSADNPIALWELGQRAGINLRIDGCDISDKAVEMSQKAAKKAGAPSQFFKLNALNERLPAGYDIVMSSLFAHHLSEEEAVMLLTKMKESSRYMVVLNDLVRSFPSLVMVFMATQMLSRSPVVHFDGPASVRAAFTPEELKKLSARAGMSDAAIYEQFPCRMMLVWKREDI
jgi:2-polyprenyl-3-methyl-5-hydroxy-6-metoxy-1,4-benzoquinol methylase